MDISKLFERYADAIFTNTIKGSVSTETQLKVNAVLMLKEWRGNRIVFNYEGNKVVVTTPTIIEPHEIVDFPAVKNIYLVSSFDKRNNNITIKYIETKVCRCDEENRNIGFNEEVALKRYGGKERGAESYRDYPYTLKNDYTFQAGEYFYIFFETFIFNKDGETQIRIRGLRRYADVTIKEGKWIITNEVSTDLYHKYDSFKDLDVLKFKSLEFVEEGRAKELREGAKKAFVEGTALLKLWRIYDKLEFRKALLFQQKFSGIRFRYIKPLPGDRTKIVLQLSDEQKQFLHENFESVKDASFEIDNGSQQEGSSLKRRFKILKLDRFTYEAIIQDEENRIKTDGIFKISVAGEKTIKDRRERALKKLISDRSSYLLLNLRLAIEGQASDMLPMKVSHSKNAQVALTPETLKYLEKFGIKEADITDKQREAIRIAITTPDIALIQGPPGTGKSTVIAAICKRLEEIAKEDNKGKKYDPKSILISAFQNDAVEHTASKVYIAGMPTMKFGREAAGLKAEEVFKAKLETRLNDYLQTLCPKDDTFRMTKRLINCKNQYLSEHNSQQIKDEISILLSSHPANDELISLWKNINPVEAVSERNDKKIQDIIIALKGLRTDTDSYNDDGRSKISKLKYKRIDFLPDEELLLENAPEMDPTQDFLDSLKKLQEKYLSIFCQNNNKIHSSNDLGLEEWIDMAIQYYRNEEEKSYDDYDTFVAAVIEDLLRDLDGGITKYLKASIKEYAESVGATNQFSGSKEMSDFDTFNTVILEEAARSNPLDLIIPLVKADRRIIMVGDQQQLPHLLERDVEEETIDEMRRKIAEKKDNITEEDNISDYKRKELLETSLFGIIYKNLKDVKPIRYIQLDEQFRMHPVIGDFISDVYYDNKLSSRKVKIENKLHNLQIPWAKDKVTIFCNVPNELGDEVAGRTKRREAEVHRVMSILNEIKADKAFDELSIGVITFYSGQVNALNEAASKEGWVEYNKEKGEYETTPQYAIIAKGPNKGKEKFRIGSVDSFQGKEFDIVILSTVRSCPPERIEKTEPKRLFGFLMLSNRLNVAFSRAQKLLIVIGDGHMFEDPNIAGKHVKGLYKFYKELSTDKQYGNRI